MNLGRSLVRPWIPAIALLSLVFGFAVGCGQIVKARNLPVLGDGLFQNLLGQFGFEDLDEASGASSEKPPVDLGYSWPAKGEISSNFGSRWGRHHNGIDIANSVGTPIFAVADGTVAYAGWSDGGYGYLIEILHPNGVRTLYAHNSKLLVTSGDVVKRSQAIALMGDSGRSTGPHLHFEIQLPGQLAVNPLAYLGKST